MYYNFRLTKKGLKFLNKTITQVSKVNVISILASQVQELNKSLITNLEKLEEVL